MFPKLLFFLFSEVQKLLMYLKKPVTPRSPSKLTFTNLELFRCVRTTPRLLMQHYLGQ